MKRILIASLLLCMGCTVKAADGGTMMTQQDIIRLLELKIPEQTVLEKVRASGTAFVLGAEDMARLKKAGASDALVAAIQATSSVPHAGNEASEITDLAIIVDYSGSMNAKMKDGQTKVASAKNCVTQLIEKLPKDLNVALVVYGTNKQRGCQDIDVVQPLGPINKAALVSKINGFNATGMTPIGASLTVAGEELKKTKGGPAIVLVTDGAESCHGDPSGVAAKLAAEFGVHFGFNVIGFGIEPSEKAGLADIAAKGHGKLMTVETANELTDALKKMVAEKVAPPAPPPAQRETKAYQAGGAAVKPGAFFGDAPATPAGDYKGGLAMMEAKYYQVMLHKGQELRAIGIVQKTPYEGGYYAVQSFVVAIYNNSLAQVAREKVDVDGNPPDPATVRATWTADADGPAYIAIAASDNHDKHDVPHDPTPKNPKPSPYTLKIKIEGDSGAGGAAPSMTRAQTAGGAGLSNAPELKAPGLATSDLKLGETAFYKLSVKKGDPVVVSAALQKPWYEATVNNGGIKATLTLTLYDDDQVQVGQQKIVIKSNPPDAQTVVVNWPATMNGSAYLSVSVVNSGGDIYPANFQPSPGRLSVQVNTGETGGGPAGGESGSKSPSGKNPFSGAEAGNK